MQVFISHVDADAKIASEIAVALETAGFTAWHRGSIFPGDNWARELGEALESSELMVVIFSRNASDVSNLQRDVQYALTSGNYRGRVVPVLVDFVSFKAGADVPWVLLKMDPIYSNSSDLQSGDSADLHKIVERVSTLAREGINASR
jgi:TIR domain